MAPNSFHLIAAGIVVVGWGASLYAADDVNVISAPTKTTAKSQASDDSDGTPAVHKSSHKKKQTSVAAASSTNPAPTTPTAPPHPQTTSSIQSPIVITKPAPPIQSPIVVSKPAPPSTPAQSPIVVTKPLLPPANPVQPIVVTKSASSPVPPPTLPPSPAKTTALVNPVPPAATTTAGPTVETGLPVAHYPGMGTPIRGVSTYVPSAAPLPPVKSHLPYFASALPTSVMPMTSAAAGSYSPQSRTADSGSTSDFVFKDLSKRVKNNYPWKSRIITTMFWIGEGSSGVSSTDNMASSWDADWRANNHGSDNPENRNGYAAGSHASTLNPFYVALPFNDLYYPDKAQRWLPYGWYRRPKDGKQVSACKDRWVMIKNSKGDVCYAQWEDVGPLRYDHAEYVFGDERPMGLGDNHAGLDVSPAVAEYLGIDHKDRPLTSWRFVDNEDVRPGPWLKLDEQAVLFTALQQLKSSKKPLPIQKASEPIDDPSKTEDNKKKVSASKG